MMVPMKVTKQGYGLKSGPVKQQVCNPVVKPFLFEEREVGGFVPEHQQRVLTRPNKCYGEEIKWKTPESAAHNRSDSDCQLLQHYRESSPKLIQPGKFANHPDGMPLRQVLNPILRMIDKILSFNLRVLEHGLPSL